MNKKLTCLLSALIVLTFIFSLSAFATSAENDEVTAIMESFAGKKVSILGDSISTMNGVSNNTSYNTTIGSNTSYYSSGQESKWWQQVIDVLGMELCVNNSWSGSMILKNNKGTADNNSAGYVTRCVNLHNDTGDTPILPDVIWVFLGTNDFTHNQSKLGTFSDIDYDTLITEGEDGAFAYATPVTVCEAYAIMLHKIQTAYPEAEVYCLNLLLRRDPVLDGKTDAGQPTEFNIELGKIIDKAGVKLVDLENCGIVSDPETYDIYISDQNVHPGAKGMDLISAALLSTMLGTDCHAVTYNAVGAAYSSTDFYILEGKSFETDVTLKESYENLKVKVTMGGTDITESAYSSGKVSISDVTGRIVIDATAEPEYKSHLQSLPEELCQNSNLWTLLTPEKNYYDGSAWNTKYYSVTFPVNAGDKIWATSFGAKGTNGNSSTDGIRITYFNADGSFTSKSPAAVYTEFSNSGYVTVPENAVAVNIPMWTSSTSYKISVLNLEHSFEAAETEAGYMANVCTVCGEIGDRIISEDFDGSVALEGFSIRLRSSATAVNGLRGICSFDWAKNTAYEAEGFILEEFGAIAVSRANYEAAGSALTFDPATGALVDIKGAVVPVWADGEYVGKFLETRNDVTQFALTAVNYKENFDSDVYFCAYSVYSLEGVEDPIVTITDYPTDEYKFVNLYQLTLDMYINGAINSSNTDDTAVWDTLLTGVVTVGADDSTGEAADMNGNVYFTDVYTDGFPFVDVPQVYYSSSSGTKTNENIKITLVSDPSSEEYVAIYRGSGAISGTAANYYGNLAYSSKYTVMPNPELTQAFSKKIKTFILDEGITATGTYAFRNTYITTFVYPASLKEIKASTFHTVLNFQTAYKAYADGVRRKWEAGLLELSEIGTVSTANFLYNMSNSAVTATKIHLPASVTSIGTAFISKGASTSYFYDVTKVWCGDTSEPQDGVIDLSGAKGLKSIQGSSFAAMAKGYSYTLILPDSCTSITKTSGGVYAFFANGTLGEVRQATYNAGIAAAIAGNSYISAKYCDLSGNEWVAPTEENTLRILAIGNSFSVDAMQWLYDIAADAKENGEVGYEYISLGNLKKSSCTLDTHWSNIQNDTGAYTYYTNTNGEWSDTSSYKISTALASQQWDIITVQQESGNSGLPDSYSNLANILNYLNENKTNENAKIYWHMTWAYQQDSTRSTFANYNDDQTTMYNAITSTVQSTVLANESIAGVIPVGTAIQNMRTSYIGDTLTRDGYHLSYGLGRYIAGMTWFAYLTGVSIDNITWVPDEYKDISLCLDAVKESVKNALTAPYAVTASEYTVEPEYTDEELFLLNGLDFANFYALDLTEYTHFQKYYQSEDYTPSSMVSGSNTAKKYIGIGTFDKTTLPIGSVIVLDSGYQYRPEGWIDAETKNSSRPGNVTSRLVVTDDDWWGDYTIRGFNLAYYGASSVVNESVAEHFRIYIPE